MPRGIPNKVEKPVEIAEPIIELAVVKLNRHYHPGGAYEIVGYHKQPVVKKMASGELKEIEPGEFIKGERAPAPVAGAIGFANKIWADTVIRLPKDEAKSIVRTGIASLEFED